MTSKSLTQRRWQVLSELVAIERAGVRMTVQGLQDHGHHRLLHAAYDLFGSFSRARAIAGIAAPLRRRRNRGRGGTMALEKAETVLRDLCRRLGRTPYQKEVCPEALRTLRHHHGNYRKALVAMGIRSSNSRQRWTEQKVVDAVRAVHSELGEVTVSRMREQSGSDALGVAVYKRFGSSGGRLKLRALIHPHDVMLR